MTFPEFATRRLLGEPACHMGSDPQWDCLACGRTKLHLYEGGDKPRLKCWVCGFGEDLPAVWKLKRGGYHRDIVAALDGWRKEWQEQVEQQARATAATPLAISSRGRGAVQQDHPLAVAAAWADLTDSEREVLHLAQLIMDSISDRGVTLGALVQYDIDHKRTMLRMEETHYLNCDDPECDAAICRACRAVCTPDCVPPVRFRFAEREGSHHAGEPQKTGRLSTTTAHILKDRTG